MLDPESRTPVTEIGHCKATHSNTCQTEPNNLLLCVSEIHSKARNMTSSTDQELATLKIESYRGIARISLDSLDFEHTLVQTQHREISLHNVHRIRGIFERNGCLRYEGDNIINAIIADSDLEEALDSANITTEIYRSIQWPRDAPTLDLTRVKCLSGLHRIEAAKSFLDVNDKWWVVRLFSDSKYMSQHCLAMCSSNQQRHGHC